MAMQLIRFCLAPKTAWMTEWQADTIAGLLAALYARDKPDEAEKELLGPWRNGQPNLVVSDAFPGDLLPAPANLALREGVQPEDRKKFRTAGLLTPTEFRQAQAGALPPLFQSERQEPYREVVRLRNLIDRNVNSTGQSGELYEAAGRLLAVPGHLSIYARVAEGRLQWAADLFQRLADAGFGADAGVGAGEFEINGQPEAVLDLEPADAVGGWISLSTFQPAATDPTQGFWRSFVKYGKLGPDLPAISPFKRPQWMLRPGACFRDPGPRRDWYGRWIDTDQLLPNRVRKELKAAHIFPGQPAFALALPMKWVDIPEPET